MTGNGVEISWAALSAIVPAIAALITATISLYKIGVHRGQQESKLTELERDIRMIETKLDKSLVDMGERITRMEDRLYNAFTNSASDIRKELRDLLSAGNKV